MRFLSEDGTAEMLLDRPAQDMSDVLQRRNKEIC
jgi:hypothetical protein